MTILEFIRKNSLLVLIVIVALGVGFLMMDYGNKGNLLTRDAYFKVNDTSYDFSEAENLGSGGLSHIHSLYFAAERKLNDKFDANGDDVLDDAENEARAAWLTAHPDYQYFIYRLNLVSRVWSKAGGISSRDEVNVAVNRAILHEVAGKIGIRPSKEQLDAYISSLPLFKKDDGSFDQALYQRLVGYKDGMVNKAYEQSLRSVLQDMMVWDILENMLVSDINYSTKAADRTANMLLQQVSGRTAWLPVGAVSKPDAPTEEEVKAYWEGRKASYKTPERRIVTIYTLTPTAADGAAEATGAERNSLSDTAETILQELSAANGRGLDDLLKKAQNDPEAALFTYEATTSSLCTETEPDAALGVEVEYTTGKAPVSTIAFKEVKTAPTPAEYGKAKDAGTLDQLLTIRQIPGYFSTDDGKIVFVRVEAIEPPAVLPYEQAGESARKDLTQEREDNALQIAADKMFKEMEAAMAEGGADAAFKKAEESGANVEKFGPAAVGIGLADSLPTGMDPAVLKCVPKGKLMAPVVSTEGARVGMVEQRTIENSYYMQKIKAKLSQEQDATLRLLIMTDWLTSAVQEMVTPSASMTRRAN